MSHRTHGEAARPPKFPAGTRVFVRDRGEGRCADVVRVTPGWTMALVRFTDNDEIRNVADSRMHPMPDLDHLPEANHA